MKHENAIHLAEEGYNKPTRAAKRRVDWKVLKMVHANASIPFAFTPPFPTTSLSITFLTKRLPATAARNVERVLGET